MVFLSKVEQVANYLRRGIERGEICQPLPNIREWSLQLKISKSTLEEALKILKKQKLIRIEPRKGIQLQPQSKRLKAFAHAPLVRWIYYTKDYPDLSSFTEIFYALSERLRQDGIDFGFERCDARRLKAIHRAGELKSEMLLFPSMPVPFQTLFSNFRNTLLIGLPALGITLPFISIDIIPALKHAVEMLARRGFRKIGMIQRERSRIPINHKFLQICNDSIPQVAGELMFMPLTTPESSHFVQRLAARTRPGQAFIVHSPVPVSLLTTGLLQRKLDVSREVEVVVIGSPQSVRVIPPPLVYPFPLLKFVKTIRKIAARYFQEGMIPPTEKIIALDPRPIQH